MGFTEFATEAVMPDKKKWWNNIVFSWVSYLVFYILLVFWIRNSYLDETYFKMVFLIFIFVIMNALLFFGKVIREWLFEEINSI